MSAPMTSDCNQDAARAHGSSLQRLVMRQFDGVTLYNADCRDVNLAGDVLISDPPYGSGRYEHDDDASVIEVLRVWPRRAFFGYPETLCEWCATLGKPDEWVTWWPTNKVTNTRAGLRRETEAVAIWGAMFERPRRTRSMDSFARKISEQNGRDTETCEDGDLWRDPSPGVRSNSHLRQHPNEKPVSFMAKLVKLCSADGETICDPYMGSGTTGVAAVRYGRRFVGVEKDPAHFATACERISRELAQGVLLPHNK